MAAKEPAKEQKVFSGKVRAIAPGFDNIKVREIGEEFHYKGVLGPWMEPVDGKAEAAKPVKEDKPKDPPSSGGKEAI